MAVVCVYNRATYASPCLHLQTREGCSPSPAKVQLGLLYVGAPQTSPQSPMGVLRVIMLRCDYRPRVCRGSVSHELKEGRGSGRNEARERSARMVEVPG